MDTGWVSPTAEAAVTSGSGDNNGFQTNPTNAYSDNAAFAVDTDSGSNTTASCTDSGKDRHTFSTYDFSAVPADASIVGLEVRLDMLVDSTSGSPNSCIELSWDGGTTWTSPQATNTLTTTEASYTLGGSANTWGHTWTVSELSAFRVRITNSSTSSKTDFSLDWLPVKVYYDSAMPTATATSTATATVTVTNTPTNTSVVTATNTPKNTATPTVTLTPTQTFTPTATATFTSTFTPTFTATPSVPVFTNATFIYDGDGKRVKSAITTNIATTTTYFVGSIYEVTGSSVTKYYYAGSQRIAMRKDGTLSFLLGDHLGSTSLVTDATGNSPIETRYKAWGEARYTTPNVTFPTNYTYTGQYSYAGDFGLMFYNAPWYDPYLNHFTQPDTLVPNPTNSVDWNRYAYAQYNPVKYSDPTGHMAADESDGAGNLFNSPAVQKYIYYKYLELYKRTKDQDPTKRLKDIDAFAQLTAYAANLTPNCTDCFVNNLGAVLTGYSGHFPGNHVILNRIDPKRFPMNQYFERLRIAGTFFGDEGFALIFRDPEGRGNQARYFWQYVQISYFQMSNVAFLGNVYHETIDPTARSTQKSYQDFVLGLEGAELGSDLRTGNVSPQEAAQYIIDTLSPNSVSADFWEDPFTVTNPYSGLPVNSGVPME